MELREALGELAPPAGSDLRAWAKSRGWNDSGALPLSWFVKNEIRCARMLNAKSYRNDPKIDERRIRALCEELDIPPEQESTPRLLARIRESAGDVTEEKERFAPALFEVRDALRDEFRIRREMMLKRCDVTVASFGCDQTHYLSKEPAHIEVGDAAAMSAERSSKLALSLERTVSHSEDVLKKHVIGDVPTRGGDVSKARQDGHRQHQRKKRRF